MWKGLGGGGGVSPAVIFAPLSEAFFYLSNCSIIT